MSSPDRARSAKPRQSASPRRRKEHRTGGKRARTREKLLDAAAGLFLSKGILSVSLDEVAAQAGLTKGAIYGNFKDKDDLVFAVAMERLPRPRPIFADDGAVMEQLTAMVHEAFSRSPAARQQLAFLTELDLYLITHEGIAKRLMKSARERYTASGENLAKIAKDRRLPLPPLQFAIVIHALFNGVLHQRAFFPDLITEEVLMKTIKALLD